MNSNDKAIQEAIFSKILGQPVKICNPSDSLRTPERVIDDVDQLRMISFLHVLNDKSKLEAIESVFSPKLEAIEYVSSPKRSSASDLLMLDYRGDGASSSRARPIPPKNSAASKLLMLKHRDDGGSSARARSSSASNLLMLKYHDEGPFFSRSHLDSPDNSPASKLLMLEHRDHGASSSRARSNSPDKSPASDLLMLNYRNDGASSSHALSYASQERETRLTPEEPESVFSEVEVIHLKIKLSQNCHDLVIYSEETVGELHRRISVIRNLPTECQALSFNGKPLYDDTRTLASLGLRNGSCIDVMDRLLGGNRDVITLDPKLFDPQYDYDFTDMKTDSKHCRGGRAYFRPLGWKRYALNVKGKYGDNTWLGMTGLASKGEWAVSYHGTREISSVDDIIKSGFDPSKTKRNACNNSEARKVYSTPHVDVAETYADFVEVNGKRYKFVFQNRINPDDMEIAIVSRSGSAYWGAGKSGLRPYGLLVKQERHVPVSSTIPPLFPGTQHGNNALVTQRRRKKPCSLM